MLNLERYTAVGLDGTVYSLGSEMSLPDTLESASYSSELIGAFKTSMRMLASGVVIVTTRVDGRPWGLTISACCSISAESPRVLVSLSRHTASLRAILGEGRFGVSILSEHQRQLAEYGASPGAPKFIDPTSLEVDNTPATPVIAGSLSHLHCDVSQVYDGGDHAIVIGGVSGVVVPSERERKHGPLVYFDGIFRRLDTLDHDEIWPESIGD
jgi:flavin reductase (DIM6/NTAB) family NADH-FMN oxidoreductase RutF